MRKMYGVVLILTICMGAGLTWAEEKPKAFVETFEQVEVGTEPAQMMILEGAFTVEEVEGKKALVLPGEPVGDFGFLFGPRLQPPVVISATITAEKKGRRSPRFGIGWGGQNGLKLFANPATKKLELFDNQTKLEETDLDWTSGYAVDLRMVIYEEEGLWHVAAWAKSVTTANLGKQPIEVESSSLGSVLPTDPRAGRASVWAQPFSGLPIRIESLEARNQVFPQDLPESSP